jgi:hypothetical protein
LESENGLIDKKWFSALIEHLKLRELNNEEKKEFEFLISEEFSVQIQNKQQKEKENAKSHTSMNSNKLVDASHIAEAGRALRLISILSLFSVAIGIGIFFVKDQSLQQVLAGVIGLFGTINILLLFSAGNQLVKSTK